MRRLVSIGGVPLGLHVCVEAVFSLWNGFHSTLASREFATVPITGLGAHNWLSNQL